MNKYNKDLEDRVIKLEEEIEKRDDIILDLLHVYRAVNAAFSMCLTNTYSDSVRELIFSPYKRTIKKWAEPEGLRPFDPDWTHTLEQIDIGHFPCIENARKIIKE